MSKLRPFAEVILRAQREGVEPSKCVEITVFRAALERPDQTCTKVYPDEMGENGVARLQAAGFNVFPGEGYFIVSWA